MDFKIYILALLLVTIAKCEFVSYEGYKVYKIVPKTEEEVKIVTDLQKQGDYQFWTDVIKENGDVRIMVAPAKQEDFEDYLASVNLEGKVAIEDVKKLIDNQLRRPQINRINNEYAWDYYQSLEEIYDWLDKTVAEHPEVASLVTIGSSVGGREIKGVKIDFKKQDNPTIGMLEGGIHAREWISPATLTWVINEFLNSNDPEIRALAENVVWHIFPVVNPDGYVYTFTHNRMWRKNRNPVSSTSCAQWNLSDDMSNGVDLNRNFGFLWNTVGASSNPCAETFAGPIPNSEEETKAIIIYVTNLKQQGNFVYYFAFHSYSQLVLVPYSHVIGSGVLELSNYADLYEIAIKGMDKLKERNGTDYLVGASADILYPVSGSSFDWARGEADIPIVYLFELRDIGEYGFLLPPELIVDNNREIMDALVEMDKVTRHIGYYKSSGNVLYFSTLMFLISMFVALF